MDVFKNDIVLELPNITAIEFTRINKNYLKVILINFFLVLFVLSAILISLHQFVFSDEFHQYALFIYIGFYTIFTILLVYLILGFSRRKYALREKDISYKSGLITEKITTVPFSRIQHVEIDEKPISRIFNLAAISVYTAGDSSDDLVIKGISKEKALQLKQFISTKINE